MLRRSKECLAKMRHKSPSRPEEFDYSKVIKILDKSLLPKASQKGVSQGHPTKVSPSSVPEVRRSASHKKQQKNAL